MPSSYLTTYRCLSCGREYSPDEIHYTCRECGCNLEAVYDYSRIAADWSKQNLKSESDSSIWRYLPLLPVHDRPDKRSIRVGGTPLVELFLLRDVLGVRELWGKDDTRNPSASLKDRASEVAIQHAREFDAQTIVCASTGNAAASLASLCAFHRQRAVVLAPASAPPAKLIQILQHGALLCLIDGSYDDAFDLSIQIAEEMGWYCRSTGINPVLAEGKKTVALEIAEQLEWRVPEYVVVPVGDGCIIGGIDKGFRDLKALGWIERIPKLIAVQAEGSSAILNALEQDSEIAGVKSETIADSISVDRPRDGIRALQAIRSSGGFGVVVTDQEILSAQSMLAEQTGIFAEPAAAATLAGLRKAIDEKKVATDASVVLLITGSGLKDIAAAQASIRIPDPVASNLQTVHDYIQDHRKHPQ